MANQNWFQPYFEQPGLEKVHSKSPFCESTYDLLLLSFLVVCSSDTYAPIKPVKQVAYHQPMKQTPKYRQNKRGAKKWILKLSLKSGDLGARTASFGIIGHQMRNWE
jgi:hypothetical protein